MDDNYRLATKGRQPKVVGGLYLETINTWRRFPTLALPRSGSQGSAAVRPPSQPGSTKLPYVPWNFQEKIRKVGPESWSGTIAQNESGTMVRQIDQVVRIRVTRIQVTRINGPPPF
jgi:hypothetical protein